MNIINRVYSQLGLAALVFSVPSSQIIAAPISFNSALPVSQNERIVRGLATINNRSGLVGGDEVEVDQLSLTSVFGYGINSKWSVFGVLPIRHTKQQLNNQSRSDTAIGDVEIFSRFEVLRIDQLGTTYRVAPFAGVRVSTGEQGVTTDGTTDVFGGVIVTSAGVRQNFDLQIRYDLNGSDNQFSAGDSINADFSWQKRVFPNKITSETKGFWFTALEANLNYVERNRLSDVSDSDSGGFVASLSPGIQYITRRWIAEFAIRIPVIKNLNGNAIEPNYSVFTGIRANF